MVLARDRRRFAAVFVAIALALSCCGSDTTGVTALDGRTFLSQSVDGHALVSSTQIRLTFEDGRLGAHAGCNALSAPYGTDEGRLVVRSDTMSTTDIGCDPALHAQDEWLGEFLQDSPQIALDGNELTLSSADTVLRLLDRRVADPDRPLRQTRWLIDTVIQGDAASSVAGGSTVTLVFSDETLTATSAGCTSAVVDVDVDVATHSLRFADFAVDDIGCPAPWDATVALLRSRTAAYSITAARLTMIAAGNGIAARAD